MEITVIQNAMCLVWALMGAITKSQITDRVEHTSPHQKHHRDRSRG